MLQTSIPELKSMGVDVEHITFVPLAIWLLYVFYKVVSCTNSPTFTPDAQASPEQRRHNLKLRLMSNNMLLLLCLIDNCCY
jgi:hypothetical protein